MVNIQTKSVINWCHQLFSAHMEEIKERVQGTVKIYQITEEDIDTLAEISVEDWTNFDNLIRQYPPPAIEPEVVNWEAVGRVLMEKSSLRWWTEQEFWANEDE